jgi:4'-phosphopantetheinyl transferase
VPHQYSNAPLVPDEVHLWTVELSQHFDESLRHAATPDEHVRAAQFRNPIDGERYVAAHGSLRLILAGYLECEPRDISFGDGELGKPFIEGADLEFNLSHSGTMALIAVARGRPVGVDVERIRIIPDQEDILARIATEEESAAFASVALSDRDAEFFRLWTRTEALCKVTGEGIGTFSPCRESISDCRLVELRDLDGYAACVAAPGFDWRLVRMARHHKST